MDDDRLILALHRLGNALSRLEAAPVAPAIPDVDPAQTAQIETLRSRVDQLAARNAAIEESHRQLADRHQRLRSRAADAVTRLNELID